MCFRTVGLFLLKKKRKKKNKKEEEHGSGFVHVSKREKNKALDKF